MGSKQGRHRDPVAFPGESGARMIAAMEQAAPPSAVVVPGGDIDLNDIPF